MRVASLIVPTFRASWPADAVIAPVWVTLPPVVTLRFPLIVLAPKSRALLSTRVTLLALGITIVMKLLVASSRVIASPLEFRVAVPATETERPLPSKICPAAETVRLPLTVATLEGEGPPISRGFPVEMFASWTLVRRAKLKSFPALVTVTSCVDPTSKVTPPTGSITPPAAWVTLPPAVMKTLPLLSSVPRTRAF